MRVIVLMRISGTHGSIVRNLREGNSGENFRDALTHSEKFACYIQIVTLSEKLAHLQIHSVEFCQSPVLILTKLLIWNC